MFDFDTLEPQNFPFKYQSKQYILREATEANAVTYEDAREACFQRDETGKVSTFRGMASTDLLLLSLTIYPVNSDGQVLPFPVNKEVIAAWPARVCKPLLEKALEMSGLNPKETEATLSQKIEKLQKQLEDLKKPPFSNGTPATSPSPKKPESLSTIS